MKMFDTCGPVTGEFKIFSLLSSANQGVKKSKITENALFRPFYWPS